MRKINSVYSSELTLLAGENTLTITPNNRTATCLTERVVDYVLCETNKFACRAPNIMPLSAWVVEVFQQLRSAGIEPFAKLSLIGDAEYVSYWVKAMHFDPLSENLVCPTEWLADALAADKSLSRWMIKNYDTDTPLGAAFKRWRVQVQRNILTSGFVTQAMAIELIIQSIKKGQVPLPKNIALYAFDEQPPLYKKLFEAFEEVGTLHTVNPVNRKATWLSVPTDNAAHQLETVARWASKVIEEEPGKTVAIVSPDLKKNRNGIVRALNDVFEPQWILPGQANYTPPYNVTLGESLNTLPLFKRAMYYLGLTTEYVQTEDTLNIINDPFTVSCRESALARRAFAKKMRDNRGAKSSLLKLAMKSQCPTELSKSLNDFVRINTSHSEYQLPSQWAGLFSQALTALGWAQGIQLNESELAGVKKWKECLDKLSCLDIHTGEIPRELAHKLLAQFCSVSLITSSAQSSPINVMGTLEAAGLDFDYIWVLDCNDNVFPAPATINACLPADLQITHNLPHSSGEKEHEFTHMLFNRYNSSCDIFYTSFVNSDDTGPKKPASILELSNSHINSDDVIDRDIIDYGEITYKQFTVNQKRDVIGHIKTNRNVIAGGVAVLDQMVLCPMRAVTSKRLNIKEHKPIFTMGFTGAERGIMIHDALEHLWRELISCRAEGKTDFDTITHLSESELLKLIEQSVDAALFWIDREDIEQTLVENERRSLITTLSQWIEIEKQRTPFNVIALEKSDFVQIGAFRLRIRKDRIDEVIKSGNNNLTVALDYKSSEESVSAAFASKIKMQLPVAAISDDTDGVGYLNVTPNSGSISGLINDEDGDAFFKAVTKHRYKAPRDWSELKHQWLSQFESLITRYASGEMLYKPSKEACKYCIKASLCEYAV